ncbi:MAG: hypothetical protein GEU80_14285 [Dehalococcoidia bacterium]|nr:hypothetical protein [Dehalococcoidia bacterium]
MSEELGTQTRAYIDALFQLNSFLQHRWTDTWRDEDWREYERLEAAVDATRDHFEDAKRADSAPRVRSA